MHLTKKVESNRLSEQEYRSIKERISYSSLKLFDTSRSSFFKQIVCGEVKKEKPNVSLILGQLVHTFLSGGQDFDQKFVLQQGKAISGQMKELVDNLYLRTLKSLDDEGKTTERFEVLFQDAVQNTKYDFDGNEIAFKKKTPEKILELFRDSDAEIYYKELLESTGKDVVTLGMIESAEKIVEKLKTHPFTREYANARTDEEQQIEVFNELPILFEIGEVPYKSMPDKMIVDHFKKHIKVLDYKTSWDAESPEYVYTKMGYYIQAGFYDMAVKYWAKEHNMKDYKVFPMKFIFCDVKGWMDPLILELSEDDVERAGRGFSISSRKYKGVRKLLEELSWHISTGIWSTSMEIHEKQGIVKLRLVYGSK